MAAASGLSPLSEKSGGSNPSRPTNFIRKDNMEHSLFEQIQIGDIVQLNDDVRHVTTSWFDIFFVAVEALSSSRKIFEPISKAPSPGRHNLGRMNLRDLLLRDGKKIT